MNKRKKKEPLFSVTKQDLEIQTFRAGGKGGQHQNKTDSAVRIVHKESGAVGVSRTERSQHVNKKIAFKRLVESPKFKAWLNKKTAEATEQQSIEERVEEMMKPSNIIVEKRTKDGWERFEETEEV